MTHEELVRATSLICLNQSYLNWLTRASDKCASTPAKSHAALHAKKKTPLPKPKIKEVKSSNLEKTLSPPPHHPSPPPPPPLPIPPLKNPPQPLPPLLPPQPLQHPHHHQRLNQHVPLLPRRQRRRHHLLQILHQRRLLVDRGRVVVVVPAAAVGGGDFEDGFFEGGEDEGGAGLGCHFGGFWGGDGLGGDCWVWGGGMDEWNRGRKGGDIGIQIVFYPTAQLSIFKKKAHYRPLIQLEKANPRRTKARPLTTPEGRQRTSLACIHSLIHSLTTSNAEKYPVRGQRSLQNPTNTSKIDIAS